MTTPPPEREDLPITLEDINHPDDLRQMMTYLMFPNFLSSMAYVLSQDLRPSLWLLTQVLITLTTILCGQRRHAMLSLTGLMLLNWPELAHLDRSQYNLALTSGYALTGFPLAYALLHAQQRVTRHKQQEAERKSRFLKSRTKAA